ncbi:MAG: radical SAM family heme chaperone HemW [Burkholderiales bacterium]
MAEITVHRTPLGAPGLKTLPPLSLYLHIPWCVRKCPYCDFNSHEQKGELPETEYCAALLRDLELSLPLTWGRRVYSIFIGGGTPSLFSASAIDEILSGVRSLLPLANDCEVTLEANPGTFEAEKFRDFHAAGVTRLSIGVQSFNPRHLKALGRIHDDGQARRAIEAAAHAFDNFNLDVMYALPGQTLDEALDDVRQAISWQSTHLSFYHLTIEPDTVFFRRPPVVPDADASALIEEAVHGALREAGFDQYETSAFARHGRRCRHNLNYWEFGDYLGLGAGAHSKISFPDRIIRQTRTKQPREYLKRVAEGEPVLEEKTLQRGDAVFEFMMNALRLSDGFPVTLFQERTGLPISAASKPLDVAEARGLILRDHLRIAPTELGRRFLNDLLELFLPEKR